MVEDNIIGAIGLYGCVTLVGSYIGYIIRECVGDHFGKIRRKSLEQKINLSSDFIWKKECRERADEIVEEYGPRALVWLQDVYQGGANDLTAFISNYSEEEKYNLRNGIEFDASIKVEKVRTEMQGYAYSEEMPFLFCPFMKKRALNLVYAHEILKPDIEDVLCYVAEGLRLRDFKPTDEFFTRKQIYLAEIGLTTKKE